MKKTTKRLVIFLLFFVMLLTAVAVVVSARGAEVPAKNSGETSNADGSITTQSILAGGYNNENYWVAAGLTEGMELCLK